MAQAIDLPVPASPGPGPGRAVALGERKTFYFFGSPDDLVFAELSADGSRWSRGPGLVFSGSAPPPLTVRLHALFARAYRATGSGGSPSLQVVGEPAQEPTPTVLEVSPFGGGLDDAPTLQAALDAAAYAGEVRLRAGTYTVSSVIHVPSGSILRGGPGVRIVSTLAPTVGGSPANCVFFAVPPPPTKASALAADTVPGSSSITLVDASEFAVGDELALSVTNYVASYEILAIAGDVVSVDRVVVHHFLAGAAVTERTVPKDIRFYLDGTVVTGTGDAAIEWSGALRCLVSGLRVTSEEGSFGDVVLNFDVGSRDCTITDCDLDAGGAAVGFAIESAERCRAERVWVRRAGLAGFFLSAGYGCELNQVHCESSIVGGVANTAEGAIGGTRALSVVGCTFVGNSGTGLDLLNGSSRIEVVNCEARHNGGTGFAVNSGSAPSADVHFANCNSSSNQAGFYVVAGCTGVSLLGCTADSCTNYGVVVDGEAKLSAIYSRECGLGALQIGVAGRVAALQLELGRITAGTWTAITNTSTLNPALVASGVRVSMAGSGTKAVFSSQAAGTLRVSELISTGGTYGWFDGGAGGTLVRGLSVDLSSTGTPYTGGTVRDATPTG
jgi:hypothetical protein